MGFPSPPMQEDRNSPPRPTTPIRQPQVKIRPLLKEIVKYEKKSGGNVSVSSPRVVLNRSQEEAVIRHMLKEERTTPFTNLRSKDPSLSMDTPSEKLTSFRRRLSQSFSKVNLETFTAVNDANHSEQPCQPAAIADSDEPISPLSDTAASSNLKIDEDITISAEGAAESDESTLIDIDTLCEQLEASTDTVVEEQPVDASWPMFDAEVSDVPNLPSSNTSENLKSTSIDESDDDSHREAIEKTEGTNFKNDLISFKSSTVYAPEISPPSYFDALLSMDEHGIFPVDNGTPFWGDISDASSAVKEGRARDAYIATKLVSNLPIFSKLLHQVIACYFT